MLPILDPSALIEPGVGMGGIKLRTHISELFDVIRSLDVRGDDRSVGGKGEASLQSPYHAAYKIGIGVTMVFNLINGRIYKLVADRRYQGSLFGTLRPGLSLQDAAHLEPRLAFDELEEVYRISGVRGVAIDTDGWKSDIETISVHVVELDEAMEDPAKFDGFERGHWS